MEKIKIQYYDSPVGEMLVGSYKEQLCICDWVCKKNRAAVDKRIQRVLNALYEETASSVVEQAVLQLEEYFAEQRKQFCIPLKFTGTEFQNAVWQKLLEIPYGTTISYGELSRRLNNPKAIRAVAAANGANPISIFVPCHRVIGSNNKLVGYAGGIEVKRKLLQLEQKYGKTGGLWTGVE